MCIFKAPKPPAPPPPPLPDETKLEVQRRAAGRRAAGLSTQIAPQGALQTASTTSSGQAAGTQTLLGA